MNMLRATVRWTGFSGAPGYSNFFFDADAGIIDGGVLGDAAQSVYDRVQDSIRDLHTILPNGVTAHTDPEMAIIDSDTGVLSEFVSVDAAASNYSGGDSGAYSAASGAVINWRTDDVRFGRRIRGRTFIVPLGGGQYDAQGTLSEDARTALLDFADSMTSGVVGGPLGVWSRPRGGTGGVFATVTGYNVPDMAAVLRSRRD